MSPALDLQGNPNGVVTLTGTVKNYMEKFAAEEAAKRVKEIAVVPLAETNS